MEQERLESKRVYWIDFAKFLAILAVMVDHTYGVLYHNQKVAFASYYSVSLFIILMGITSYWSSNRAGQTDVGKGAIWLL